MTTCEAFLIFAGERGDDCIFFYFIKDSMLVDEDITVEEVRGSDGHFKLIFEIDSEDIVVVCVFGAHI